MTAKRPPGPPCPFFGLPLIRQIGRDVLGFFVDMHREYGDVAYMRLGPFRDYTFFHPDAIREVLVEKAKQFIRLPRPIQVLRQWNGDGLLTTEGETWLRHRRIVLPAFQPKRFADYATAIVDSTSSVYQRLDTNAGPVDFEELMYDLTTSIICRTMFGTDLGDERAEVRRAVHTLSVVAVREMMAIVLWPDWLPLPGKAEKRWAMRKLDETIRGFIRERRQTGDDRGDLLSMLLLAVDEEGDRRGLTDEQARDHCMTIFLAGHDTTAAALTWVGWVLADNPDVAARATAEVDQVLGNRMPTFADLPRLEYVERVVRETLRHYPPAIGLFARQAASDVEIGGWQVPRGAIVRVFPYVTQHDPRWFPNPDRIDPDRFARERVHQIPPHAYVPFGAGPRVCIGQNFALMEMVLAVALLLQRFTIERGEQREPRPYIVMSLRPEGGLRLLLRRRDASHAL